MYFSAAHKCNVIQTEDPGGPIMKSNAVPKFLSILLVLVLLLTPVAPLAATGETPISLVPAIMAGNSVTLTMQVDSTWEGYFNGTITLTNTG